MLTVLVYKARSLVKFYFIACKSSFVVNIFILKNCC